MACVADRNAAKFILLLFVTGLVLQSTYAQQYDPSFGRLQQVSDNPNADFGPRMAVSGSNALVCRCPRARRTRKEAE